MVALLDNPETYTRLDPSRMRDRLRSLGKQCGEAAHRVSLLGLPQERRQARAVVVAGMGSSAISGELLADLATFMGVSIPIVAWRDYGLPPWVDTETLVITSSFSGETEETLSAFDTARERKLPVVAVASGGALTERARSCGVPVLRLPPGGEPRNALGYSFVTLLGALCSLGLMPDLTKEIEKTARLLEELAAQYSEVVPESGNPAKAMARALWGRVPVVYGAHLLAGVARRWKTDLNENAKTWAVAETLPEVDHNSIVGYGLPGRAREDTCVVFLSSPLLPQRLQERYQVTGELLRRAKVDHLSVDAQGNGPLSHQLSLVYLGGWTSYYLAMLYGVDPSVTEPIRFLKERLGSGKLAEEQEGR
ncbi:MAG: bifunctional phosphoglucose/phosphomannose isomerase [Chloroflexi bacterium]|nr:bifunctional phosphoglucose/phosphomannose isomerase [Chloroflexota bacterium]